MINANLFEEVSLVGERGGEAEERVKRVFMHAADLCFAAAKKERAQGCCVVI